MKLINMDRRVLRFKNSERASCRKSRGLIASSNILLLWLRTWSLFVFNSTFFSLSRYLVNAWDFQFVLPEKRMLYVKWVALINEYTLVRSAMSVYILYKECQVMHYPQFSKAAWICLIEIHSECL